MQKIMFVALLLAPMPVAAQNFWAMRILRVPEAREGWQYLDRVVAAGYATMRARDVRSAISPNRKIADLYPAWIAKTIIVIEHSGEGEYRPDMARPVIRVLRVFARSADGAFAADRSWAGAEAMAQFLPASYQLMRGLYPRADLPSFGKCIQEHACQVRAMLCHFDAGRVPLSAPLRRRLAARELHFALNIAAAYNAGGDRAASAVRHYPRGWMQGSGLPWETRGYLWKFRRAHLPILAMDRGVRARRRIRFR